MVRLIALRLAAILHLLKLVLFVLDVNNSLLFLFLLQLHIRRLLHVCCMVGDRRGRGAIHRCLVSTQS